MDRSEWVLVPRVPTEAMVDAARGFSVPGYCPAKEQWPSIYTAMIAAAPPPPAEQASGEHVAGAGWIEPSERDDASLIEVTLQLHARSLMYGTEQQHNDTMACKAEILRRLALSQRPVVVRPVNEPPENAPAHSVRVVVYLPEHGWRMGWYTRFMADKGEWPWSADTFTGLTNKTITHWMPEPPAPQQPEKGEG